jgi:hypothetical protein
VVVRGPAPPVAAVSENDRDSVTVRANAWAARLAASEKVSVSEVVRVLVYAGRVAASLNVSDSATVRLNACVARDASPRTRARPSRSA